MAKLDLSLTSKLSKNAKNKRCKKTKSKQVVKSAPVIGSNAGQIKRKTTKFNGGVVGAMVTLERKKKTPLSVLDTLISDEKYNVGYYNVKVNAKPTEKALNQLLTAGEKLENLKEIRQTLMKGKKQ